MTKTAFVAAALAAGVVLSASIAEGKGPGGGGGGAFHSVHNDAVSPGMATPGVEPSPPGWNSQGERQGWEGASTPPGWDNGQRKGWADDALPPGFNSGNKKGWETTVTPAQKK
jgi:hypothetical protein